MIENTRYESTFIVGASVAEEIVEGLITKGEDIIRKNGGEIIETERWGRRKLAYDIEKESSGFYISLHFTAPGNTIAKLERFYQLDELVLRWLTLVMPEENIQRRAAMNQRVQDVIARRALETREAEEEEKAKEERSARAARSKRDEEAPVEETADAE